MSLTNADLTIIQSKIAPLLGQPSWEVFSGVGSFLGFDFGKRIQTRVQPRPMFRGEWHLWIRDCNWQLAHQNRVRITAEDDRQKIREEIKYLKGLAIQSVTIDSVTLQTVFCFEEGWTLRLFAEPEDCEFFWLFMPDGNVLHLGPGAAWASVKASDLWS
jgi:hypothetical protein